MLRRHSLSQRLGFRGLRQAELQPGWHWPFGARRSIDTRLLATVSTDVVGYSRLFALDDAGTVSRMRKFRRQFWEPAIKQHEGVLVQTAGDSMLVVFDSVVGAVTCAVLFQLHLAESNERCPESMRVNMRVGVDLGDVILDGYDFHGDGVIVATRLQSICPPGAVCVSRAVFDRGGARLGLRANALGPLDLKNVAGPVEAMLLWPNEQSPRVLPFIRYEPTQEPVKPKR
jgi:adenylate cyclase